MDNEYEGTSNMHSGLSVKTLTIIFIPLIILFSSVGFLLPYQLTNTYVIGYILSLTIITLFLSIRVYHYHFSSEIRHALMGFLIAHILFWGGGISWTVSLASGRQEVMLIGTILIISAYATFVYICLEPLKCQCHKISKHKVFQIFSGNAVLYILFSTPIFYDVLTNKKHLHDELIYFIHPVLDILIFTFVLLMLTLCYKMKLGYHWRWISFTFLFMIAGDLFFTYHTILDIRYLSMFAGIFYNIAYGLLVFGLLIISVNTVRITRIKPVVDKL